ncbi:MAG TPA: zinc ABC transporter substrate-binding protein [Bacillota bacterium]|nr:zinc ABC transporter substrate-binding protein [Bacillota bacterium]
MKKLLITMAFLFLIFTIACEQQTDAEKQADYTIYTSIYPIEFIVEQLTDDHVYVQSIYPPGVDAHTYEPTSREITNMANADAFIYFGDHLEGFAQTAADVLINHPVRLIELSEHDQLFEHADHSTIDRDPHIWLDPLRMITLAELIKDELIMIDKQNEATIERNFLTLEQKFRTLDETFMQMVAQKQTKDIIVTHAAYGYWEERYGIKQIPINGVSTSEEPSQKELVEIVNNAQEKQIDYVIFEQMADDKTSKIIQEHLGAKALRIHNLEVLTERDIDNGEDYFSLMEENIKTLDQAMKESSK